METNVYSWIFLKQFHKNPPYQNILRKPEIEKEYLLHKKKLKEKNVNIENYLVEKLFKNNIKYVITCNEFPYNLEKNIDHKLLWINPKYNDLFDDNFINNIIELRMKGKLYIYFENIDSKKSIKSIKHFHIFINNLDDNKNNYL